MAVNAEASVDLCCYCKKNASERITKCVECGKVYHKSCASRVICCEKPFTDDEGEKTASLSIPVTYSEHDNQNIRDINPNTKYCVDRLQIQNTYLKME